MSKNTFIIIIGIIIMLIPVSGFPPSGKTFLFLACGALLVLAGLISFLKKRFASKPEAEGFVENRVE